MLTRLQVSGFKNLVDIDVRFSAFTCVAGANGVGKSNLFDAIKFLSALADRHLLEAAKSVRDEGGRASDMRGIFHRMGNKYEDEMSFCAEMIIPSEGVDDSGQKAKAANTFLRYSIKLAYRIDEDWASLGKLEILNEELTHITKGEANQHIAFPHKPAWRNSIIQAKRRVPYLISTHEEENRIIRSHQDGRHGRALPHIASNLTRTVLSLANAVESPTAALARNEMRSWRLLQLEPSALRQPDDFISSNQIEADGKHLAAMLYSLARSNGSQANGKTREENTTRVYSEVAGRLAELIDDVYDVTIDRDEKRELLTLLVSGRDRTLHPAKSLSDGTLRFLALSVIELDAKTQGVLCLEEPENGIHPARIPAILKLLQDIAVDVTDSVSLDNPMRQVIVNTHSPAVVLQVPDESLLIASLKEKIKDSQLFKGVEFKCLRDTWRAKAGTDVVSKGSLLSYLNPFETYPKEAKRNKYRRVMEHPDLQPLLPFIIEEK